AAHVTDHGEEDNHEEEDELETDHEPPPVAGRAGIGEPPRSNRTPAMASAACGLSSARAARPIASRRDPSRRSSWTTGNNISGSDSSSRRTAAPWSARKSAFTF